MVMAKVKNLKRTGLSLVLERNLFYTDNFRKINLIILLLLVVNLVLSVAIVYKYTHPTPPKYFATTADGRIIQTKPLTDPVVTDSFVMQWASDQVRQAFSLDYMHWRQQLEVAQNSFTPSGWKYFVDSLKKSNNLTTLTDLKMVSNAEIVGAPEISRSQVLDGHYVWDIKFSLLVTYSNINKNIPMPMDINLIVMRMPVNEYDQGIAINNFLPIVTNSR